MILADTNVIIDFWRHPDDETAHIFAAEDIAICGIVKAELLHGARNTEDCRRIMQALEEFPCLNMRETDWAILGLHLQKLRTHGATVPFQDAAIATLAIAHQVSVWTNDKHFERIKELLPELQLYKR